MTPRILLILAAAGCSANAAPSPPGLTRLATARAWDVATVADRLVVIDDGFRTATALDAATGKQVWQVTITKEPQGRHTLHPVGGTVIAWAGEKRHVIDGASGKVVASASAPMNGVEWDSGGCHLDVVEGACADRCGCSFQLVDCSSAKPLGPRYQARQGKRRLHEHGHSSACWGNTASLHVRAGRHILFAADDGAQDVTAAIDATTGVEAWRRSERSTMVPHSTGRSADARTCWVSDVRDDDPLRVLDCATGKLLWSEEGKGPLAATAVGRDVFVTRGAVASLRDARTGKPRWSVTLPERTLAWPRGAAITTSWDADDITRLAILEPATGKTARAIALPPKASFVLDGAGGVLVTTATELVAYGADGLERARTKVQGEPAVQVGPTILTLRYETHFVVLARSTLREVGRIADHVEVLHLEGALGPGRLAAFAYDGKRAGVVSLYAVP